MDEKIVHSRTKFHGLDLTDVKNKIFAIKRDRMNGGREIGVSKFKTVYKRPGEFEPPSSYQWFTASFQRLNTTETTLEMEYEAQVYNWNNQEQAWE